MWELMVRLEFSAAHQLRNYRGRCERMHGHNWIVEVRLESDQLDDCGLAMDFCDVNAEARKVLERLDHQVLNDLAPFRGANPSAENLAAFIFRELGPAIPAPCRLLSVTVFETPGMSATYREKMP